MNDEALQTLKPTTRAWVEHVRESWALEQHHERLLLLAGQAWDRCQQACRILDEEGLTVATATGLKTHPAMQIERDNRLQFARLLRELQLDNGDADEPRIPGLYK